MRAGELLDAAAAGAPDRTALIIDGTEITYGELGDAVGRTAAALRAAGVGRGDRVALLDVASVLSTVAVLAAARVGAAAAMMNVHLTASELRQLVEDAGCAPVGVAGDDHAEKLGAALDGTVLGPTGTLEHPEVDDTVEPVEDDADAVVLFTSGTTGLPKPIPIDHDVLVRRTTSYFPAFDAARPPSTSLMCVPVYHVGGLIGLLGALYSGNTMVLQPRFDAGEWLELVERYRVQGTFLVPTMLQRVLDHPDFDRRDLSSVATVAYGAAAAPTDLIERALQAFPDAAFANVFGQTETLGAYTTLLPEDHRDPRRIGSVGRPLPGVELRIVEPGTDREVETGEIGELWVRSPQNVFEGWLQTGDLARMDEDGYLYPAGRLSDTINRGGEKFGPIEVERALRSHPAVAEAAVAGIPDHELGERVGAAVVVTAPVTPDELRAHCREHIARYKVPSDLVIVDELPYTETGKVRRRELVELIAGVEETS